MMSGSVVGTGQFGPRSNRSALIDSSRLLNWIESTAIALSLCAFARFLRLGVFWGFVGVTTLALLDMVPGFVGSDDAGSTVGATTMIESDGRAPRVESPAATVSA